MNERQPYERHLADKLQNLPPPGEVDQTWEQMRTLLDKEMPRGGAMPDRRRWWLFGIAVGILFLATWLSGGSYFDRANPDSVAQDSKSTGSPAASATVPGNSQSTPGTEQPAIAGTAGDQPVAAGQALSSAADEPLENANRGNPPATTAKNSQTNTTGNNRQPNADDAISTLSNKRSAKNNKAGSLPENKAGAASRGANAADGKRTALPAPGQSAAGTRPAPAVSPDIQAALVQAPFEFEEEAGTVLATGTTLDKDYGWKKAGLPEPVVPKPAPKRNQQKLPQAGTFAIGFSLPLAFPLGDQRAMGYNITAGHNTVSDYLPSPHLQYHFNSKTFLQTEAQVASPQFIRSTLLYETTRPLSPGYYTTNSVYAKKLYYFNVPVSIHHSPFPGFYMGTGIQFSSVISGVAMSELKKWDMGGNSSLISETYSRFRNDSLSEKLSSNEFRVLLDANYYFNRFTVGLRYNQALSNYISFRIAPGQPYSFERNRALQFYLRYNLWEEKKRTPAGKNLLSLK